MRTRSNKYIATPPYKTIEEMFYMVAVESFSNKSGLDLNQSLELFSELRDGKPITKEIADLLEKGGMGSSKFWLNLQKIYDDKMEIINV